MSTQTSASKTWTRARGQSQRMGPGLGLSRGMVTLFAFAAGLAVANIYYAQPLLTSIADTFHIGPGAVSWVVTATTIGYAMGLCLLVPLGDMVDRRRLLIVLLLMTAAGLVACAAAPSFPVLLAASVVLSLAAVSGPVLVPMAATLAVPEQRGRVTGTVMSGVLVGVLLSRAAGGLVAQLGGWRSVFWTAAALTVVLAVILAVVLPKGMAPASRISYRRALTSTLGMLRSEPSLRIRCAYGFLGFGTFSVFWTSVSFLLTHSPYHFDDAAIGLFALVGASGATAARITGRLADRGLDYAATGAMLLLILAGWALNGWLGGQWLIALVAGAILLDFGVQGAHVTNFGVIYRLPAETRSRVTTAYMTSVFFGGVVGSASAGAAYSASGWRAVCLAGGLLGVMAVLLWTGQGIARRRAAARQVDPTGPDGMLPQRM
jgi:predicted MFS family arabinose efflux permease